MISGKFGTVINCIDGRVQLPVSSWIKENYSLDYVDTITEPGPEKTLSDKNIEKLSQLKSKVLISIKAHGSKIVVISGHYDCAGNPVSKEMQIRQIRKSINVVNSWRLPTKTIGLWVNDLWNVEGVYCGQFE